jgi:hypothetical protein
MQFAALGMAMVNGFGGRLAKPNDVKMRIFYVWYNKIGLLVTERHHSFTFSDSQVHYPYFRRLKAL